ncbi:OmpW family protein [Nitrospirillum sp. BR 11752]|uniref:OmpW/AlkL family protein n=1 Tax=Nitrospirillum sp. BR 11752 TaxID=3104293 RepID=UPI002EB4B6E5|nr:OmpW family protein [Nitrospirillum sp. BR 11752]
MKFLSVTAAAVALLAGVYGAASTARASDAGDFLIRGRALVVAPDVGSSLSLGGAGIPGHTDISTAIVPELDFSYFFTDSIAAELIAGTTPHNVKASGTPLGKVDLGNVWLLPPTLTLQYHFMPHEKISPYIGVGVNYTLFYGIDKGDALAMKYDNNFGYAFQAGVDYKLDDHWSLNVDLKKLMLNTTATVNAGLGTPIKADVDINPWLVGFGVGYRF